MSDASAVLWRRHPRSGKWHAFKDGTKRSVCDWTEVGIGEGQKDVPPWACYVCCSHLGVEPPPMQRITRSKADNDRCEQWEAELIGGPEDGTRLLLDVVRDGPDTIRVLEQSYTKRGKSVRSSEVEKEATR